MSESPATPTFWSTVRDALRGTEQDLTSVPIQRSVLLLAIPMVLRGVELRLVPTNGGDVWAYGFRADTGIVSVWLDARFDAKFSLASQQDPSMLGAHEGDMLLF